MSLFCTSVYKNEADNNHLIPDVSPLQSTFVSFCSELQSSRDMGLKIDSLLLKRVLYCRGVLRECSELRWEDLQCASFRQVAEMTRADPLWCWIEMGPQGTYSMGRENILRFTQQPKYTEWIFYLHYMNSNLLTGGRSMNGNKTSLEPSSIFFF